MNLIDPFIEEVKHETASTRKLLERIPDGDLAWRPHPKSMSLIELASHIVETLDWVKPAIDEDQMDLDPDTYRPWQAKDGRELLAKYDANLETALSALEGLPDEKLAEIWTMTVKGTVALSMPRMAVLRIFIISHTIHHRGQLSVYLRLRDIPVPQVYGPTADEQDAMAG